MFDQEGHNERLKLIKMQRDIIRHLAAHFAKIFLQVYVSLFRTGEARISVNTKLTTNNSRKPFDFCVA